MVLDSFLSNQSFKSSRGYYINHDTLMTVDPSTRSKLIAFFMLEQTPQKLSTKLVEDYQSLRTKYTLPPKLLLFTGLFWTQLKFQRRLSSAVISRPLMDIALITARLGLAAWFADSVGNQIAQPIMIGSDAFQTLSQQIKPTIYDFHQSKRDSILAQHKATMIKEINGLFNIDHK